MSLHLGGTQRRDEVVAALLDIRVYRLPPHVAGQRNSQRFLDVVAVADLLHVAEVLEAGRDRAEQGPDRLGSFDGPVGGRAAKGKSCTEKEEIRISNPETKGGMKK